MTIVESRLKKGTLTFGDDEAAAATFACQATNVHVTPSYDDDGDPLETLCGDEIPAGKKESWVIGGTSIQDFDEPEGFLAYCFDHSMETVEYSWQPNPAAPTYSGRCVIVALEEGGDVATRLDTDWEFDCLGRPVRTYGAPPAQLSTRQVGNTVTATAETGEVSDTEQNAAGDLVTSPGVAPGEGGDSTGQGNAGTGTGTNAPSGSTGA